MKRLSFLLVCFLLTVSCATAQPTPTLAPTAQAAITQAPLLPTLPAADTPLPPTHTTAPLPTSTATTFTPTNIGTATATATNPPTKTPIPTKTTTATLPPTLPSPVGRIYFLWDSNPFPPSAFGDPEQGLYMATAGATPSDWHVELVLSELIGWPQSVLSPDKSKLALTVIEDSNGDGNASQEENNRGFDFYHPYVYDITNQTFTRLSSGGGNPNLLSWLPDNQTIFYQSPQDIFTINIDASPAIQLTTVYPEHIEWASLSPDSQFVAVNLQSAQVNFVKVETGEFIPITNEIGGIGVDRAWSSDSQWFALNQSFTQRFFIVNVNTLEVTQLSEFGSVGTMAWSPNKSELVFVQNTPNGINLLLFDPVTFNANQLISFSATIRHLSWSPDSENLVVVLQQGGLISLNIITISTGVSTELWQGDEDIKRLYFGGWSPDNQWLLFFAGQQEFMASEDQAYLYTIHRSGGEAYSILETSGSYDPYAFYWLSQ